MEWLDSLTGAFGEGFARDVATWTTALGVASYIHSGRVKKELRAITDEIRSLSTALRGDLDVHDKRISVVENRIDGIEKSVSILVKPLEGK